MFLLDDHEIVRRGLRDLLAPARDISVVGESGSAKEASRVIPELKPDVMLLDVQLQDGTGIEVCRRVRAVDSDIHGLLLTSAGDDEALLAAILAGAAGYLIKLSASVELLSAVRRVGSGKALIDRGQRARVSERLRAELTDGSPRLSTEDRELLSFLLDGATDAEIVERTGLSTEAVRHGVASFVGQLTGSLLPAPGWGKHRRPDG